MIDPIRELKVRAEILQRELNRRHPASLTRLRTLPGFRAQSASQLELAGPGILRRQCLSVISLELGFSGWQHACAVLSGTADVSDFGTLLYPKRGSGHLNLWYRNHEEAVAGRRESNGYLLAYRRDFFVADRSFIELLGWDPEAPEWGRLGYDWLCPSGAEVRRSLYGELIARLPQEVEA